MNLYRTGESGLAAVQPLDPAEIDGLARELLRGPGGTLGSDDVLFVTTAVDDGVAAALALDEAGDVVVVAAADRVVDSETVTGALQRASAAADSDYDALAERFAGEGSLREAHADYFDRDALDPAAFNGDQRVRLLGPAFDADALDLATFLSDREVTVDAVRVEAFGDTEHESFLVRFDAVDDGADATDAESEHDEPAADTADTAQQWVAGASAAAASDTASRQSSDDETDTDAESAVTRADGSSATGGHQSALGETEVADDSGGADTTGAADDARAADDSAAANETIDDEDETDEEAGEGDESAETERDETLELPVLLNAVADGLGGRLVGTFDESADELLSVERGNELLVRPDHPAYAGGVLRYRLRAESDGTVEFEVYIYGGSEAEKEQMRAVVRENEIAIEDELGYTVSDRYDGFSSTREFARFDQVAAAEIVDEFDRLVRFFHPRVMRA